MFIIFVNQKIFEMICVWRKRYLNEVVQWGFKKRKLEKVVEKVCDSCDGILVLVFEIICWCFQFIKDMLQWNKENRSWGFFFSCLERNFNYLYFYDVGIIIEWQFY